MGMCVCTFGETIIAFFRFPKGNVTPDRERIMELAHKTEICSWFVIYSAKSFQAYDMWILEDSVKEECTLIYLSKLH